MHLPYGLKWDSSYKLLGNKCQGNVIISSYSSIFQEIFFSLLYLIRSRKLKHNKWLSWNSLILCCCIVMKIPWGLTEWFKYKYFKTVFSSYSPFIAYFWRTDILLITWFGHSTRLSNLYEQGSRFIYETGPFPLSPLSRTAQIH